MRVLLVCAGGMSTGIIKKALLKYCDENGKSLEIEAVGLSEYEDVYEKFDCILVAPQTRFKADEIADITGKPTDVIDSTDYALINCPNMYKQIESLAARK